MHWIMSLLWGLLGLGPVPRPASTPAATGRRGSPRKVRPRFVLSRTKYAPRRRPGAYDVRVVRGKPYLYATKNHRRGEYLDFSGGGDPDYLRSVGLPLLKTPEEIAHWLQIRPGELLWLTHAGNRFKPPTAKRSHYVVRTLKKKIWGIRVLECPKSRLKQVQERILREILDRVPLHSAAHGFARHRSILTNAAEHVGQTVVVRFDLENFYGSVRYSRVVAIFRSIGYPREAALWLARLTTSRLAPETELQLIQKGADHRIRGAHLPQGAPTSPALANLSAFSLDLRLSGLARTFDGNYTRYADDLTFSGDARFANRLGAFLPLVRTIIGQERFSINWRKRRIARRGAQQRVTGLVVNDELNVPRADFDRLKAILHNCLKQGPASQNRANHPNFAAHLQGRIAFIASVNPTKAARLQQMFQRIRWS